MDSQRRKGLNAFILALSDQQLVTGLAMITAALAQRCSISCYEFQVVNSLAWLSSTTHLITLIVLQEHFLENKVVRNYRAFGMLSMFVLLSYVTIVSSASYSADKSSPILCIMSNADSMMNIDFISVFCLAVSYGEDITNLYIKDIDPLDSRVKTIFERYCCRLP